MESIIDRNRCYRASRQFAIKWFREFNTTEQQALCDKFEEFGFRRTCTTLTGSEIVRLFEFEIRANNEVLEDLLNIVEENVIAMCCKHVNTPFVNPKENPIELELQPIYVSEFDNSEPLVVFQSSLVSSVSFTMSISQEEKEHIIANFLNVKTFFKSFIELVVIEHYPELYATEC